MLQRAKSRRRSFDQPVMGVVASFGGANGVSLSFDRPVGLGEFGLSGLMLSDDLNGKSDVGVTLVSASQIDAQTIATVWDGPVLGFAGVFSTASPNGFIGDAVVGVAAI